MSLRYTSAWSNQKEWDMLSRAGRWALAGFAATISACASMAYADGDEDTGSRRSIPAVTLVPTTRAATATRMAAPAAAQRSFAPLSGRAGRPAPLLSRARHGPGKAQGQVAELPGRAVLSHATFRSATAGPRCSFPSTRRKRTRPARAWARASSSATSRSRKDGALVCRHDECDLHTTTNIVDTPLNNAARCRGPARTPRRSAARVTSRSHSSRA